MKVLLLNGSPNQHGCTHTALCEVAARSRKAASKRKFCGLAIRRFAAASAAAAAPRSGKRRCVFGDDLVNTALDKMRSCDGLVVGSPVHYAAAGGSITSFLDRMFYAGGSQMRAKVGAAVCSARRAGTTATLDQLSKYFTICGMPIAPSQYWPMVHGSTPEDVRQDEEGMQIMRMLGRNHGVYDPAPLRWRGKTGCFRPTWRSRKCAPTSSVDFPLLIRRMKRPKSCTFERCF